MIPPEVRAVFFDAIGTLLEPDPPVEVVYTRAGVRFGSRLNQETVASRFRIAFQYEEKVDHAAGLRTDERRERERWHHIIAHVLDDVSDKEGCFLDLYNHFARAEAWRCPPDLCQTLRQLAERGYILGMASNADSRLRAVVANRPELRLLRHLVISSEVGWRKPSSHFFKAVQESSGVPAAQILYVGDDPINDYGGARVAGLRAILFDPEAVDIPPYRPMIPRVSALVE